MKKTALILSILASLLFQSMLAQKAVTAKREISTWTISDKTTAIITSSIDTSVFKFQNSNPIDKYSIAKSYNGTLGSPLQSKIYFDRTEKTDFLFSSAYDAYFLSPTDIIFYNTKTPYSNLTYYSSGKTISREEDLNALFSINGNKRLNFTGLFNYAMARGVYDYQATKMVKGGLWGSYLGRVYSATGIAMFHSFDNEENGGIENKAYITRQDSLTGYESASIPVNLSSAMSRYKNKYLYFNQKIHIGRGNDDVADTLMKESIPVATISHTLKMEEAQKRYKSTSSDASYYTNTYFDKTATLDSARYLSVRNNVAVTINEGFSKWFPLGITAYVEDDYREYYYLNDTLPVNVCKNDFLIGAEMAKRKGKAFLFNVNGELYTVGAKAGDFNLNGGISSSFRLLNDTVSLIANGYIKNYSPSFFENTYVSNHFIWANNFDKTFKTNLDGTLMLHNKWVDASVGLTVQNVTNYIYFDEKALPAQYGGNIQILAGNIGLNFKFGPLYFQNKIIYQKATNETILPLPDISTYNNLFFGFKVFKKVLTAQLGTDVYYHTAYYAPNYMPATGAFYLQTSELVGNYPIISIYANFHLKTATFFLKYSHINSLFMEPNYFSMPNYPLYPDRFRMGMTWNFFD